MPLLYGSPSRGGLGGIKGKFNQARIGNRRNKFQQQIGRNPKFGLATFNRPPPETEGGPKLATPLTNPEGGGSELARVGAATEGGGDTAPTVLSNQDRIAALVKQFGAKRFGGGAGALNFAMNRGINPGEVAGFEQEGGGFTGRRSEAIPMMGMPGAGGGTDISRIAQFLPDNIRRMMGV